MFHQLTIRMDGLSIMTKSPLSYCDFWHALLKKTGDFASPDGRLSNNQ